MSGTSTLLASFIFSMPSATTAPAHIAMTSPSRGTPVMLPSTNSLPASIATRDIPAEKNIIAPTILPLGTSPSLPASKNKRHKSDMNTEDSATFKGDAAPKNSASSLPLENPAPIAVPMYKNVTLSAFFIRKAYAPPSRLMILDYYMWAPRPHPGKGRFALCNPKLKTRARQMLAVARVFDCYASYKLLRESLIFTSLIVRASLYPPSALSERLTHPLSECPYTRRLPCPSDSAERAG